MLTVPAATGVLANDTDPEQGTLTAQLVTSVAANTGTLALSPNGSFTYTPSSEFFRNCEPSRIVPSTTAHRPRKARPRR